MTNEAEDKESDARIASHRTFLHRINKTKIKRKACRVFIILLLLYPSTPKALSIKYDKVYISKLVHQTQFILGTAKVSWYGGRFNGRRTANGEIYCKDSLTCAHNKLPFNTVVNISYGNKTISVRVNDRGKIYDRDFDLSEGAAQQLGIIDIGVAMVETEMTINNLK